jgi:hypothetical protein
MIHFGHVQERGTGSHTGSSVNGQLTLLIDGSPETAVVATGIVTLSVAQWVIDMLGRLVAPQTLGGDLKFASAIANRKKVVISPDDGLLFLG